MRRVHTQLLTAGLALALAGCKTAEPLVRTETVTLPQSKYVGVPPELTQPCPIAEGALADVVEVARLRRESLEVCNGKLRRIRDLSEQAAKQAEGKSSGW